MAFPSFSFDFSFFFYPSSTNFYSFTGFYTLGSFGTYVFCLGWIVEGGERGLSLTFSGCFGWAEVAGLEEVGNNRSEGRSNPPLDAGWGVLYKMDGPVRKSFQTSSEIFIASFSSGMGFIGMDLGTFLSILTSWNSPNSSSFVLWLFPPFFGWDLINLPTISNNYSIFQF